MLATALTIDQTVYIELLDPPVDAQGTGAHRTVHMHQPPQGGPMLIQTTAMPAQGARSRVTRDRYEQRARRREQLIATVVDLHLPVGRRRHALAALEREADGLSLGLLERLQRAGYPEPGRILGAVRNGNLLAVQSIVRACNADRLAGCLDRVASVAAWAHTEPARLF